MGGRLRGGGGAGVPGAYLKPKTMTLEESLGHSQAVRYKSL